MDNFNFNQQVNPATGQPIQGQVGYINPGVSTPGMMPAPMNTGITGAQAMSSDMFSGQAFPVLINNTVNIYGGAPSAGVNGGGFPAQGGFPSTNGTPIGSVMNPGISGSVLNTMTQIASMMATVVAGLTQFIASILQSSGSGAPTGGGSSTDGSEAPTGGGSSTDGSGAPTGGGSSTDGSGSADNPDADEPGSKLSPEQKALRRSVKEVRQLDVSELQTLADAQEVFADLNSEFGDVTSFDVNETSDGSSVTVILENEDGVKTTLVYAEEDGNYNLVNVSQGSVELTLKPIDETDEAQVEHEETIRELMADFRSIDVADLQNQDDAEDVLEDLQDEFGEVTDFRLNRLGNSQGGLEITFEDEDGNETKVTYTTQDGEYRLNSVYQDGEQISFVETEDADEADESDATLSPSEVRNIVEDVEHLELEGTTIPEMSASAKEMLEALEGEFGDLERVNLAASSQGAVLNATYINDDGTETRLSYIPANGGYALDYVVHDGATINYQIEFEEPPTTGSGRTTTHTPSANASEAVINYLQANFDEIDTDNNGVLDRDELSEIDNDDLSQSHLNYFKNNEHTLMFASRDSGDSAWFGLSKKDLDTIEDKLEDDELIRDIAQELRNEAAEQFDFDITDFKSAIEEKREELS